MAILFEYSFVHSSISKYVNDMISLTMFNEFAGEKLDIAFNSSLLQYPSPPLTELFIRLFEISELISVSTKEELLTIIELYNLTKDEIKFMITELYKPFDGYIVDLNQEQMRRKEYLNELILLKDIEDNYIINNLDLTDLEKKIIIEKRNLLNYCIKDNVNCK